MSNEITPALGPEVTYQPEVKDEKSVGPVEDEIEIKGAHDIDYDNHLDGTEEVAVME